MSVQINASMQVRFRTVNGINIRYAESEGPRENLILLTNPWPESLYAFLPIWQMLSTHSHLLAIDLPGFGYSERRDDLLSPQTMGTFLIQLIDEWGLHMPHIVAPDVGSSAALFAAAQSPDHVRSLMVGNGGTIYPLQVTGILKDIIEAPDLKAFQAVDSRTLLGPSLDEGHDHYKLPPEIREDYLQSYAGDRFVKSMSYVRNYPQDLPILGKLLPDIQTPVQIMTCLHDPVVPPINGEYLHAQLPNSKYAILDAGHYPWEDNAEQYTAIISAWVNGGYLHPQA